MIKQVSSLIFFIGFLFPSLVAVTQRSTIRSSVDWIVTPTVTYTKTVFARGNADLEPSLFLAGAKLEQNVGVQEVTFEKASTDEIKKYAVARLVLEDGMRAEIMPLAGTTIADQMVTHIALINDHYPVLAMVDDQGASPKVQLMTDLSSAGNLTDGVAPTDAKGTAITSAVVGMTTGHFWVYDTTVTTSKNYIFVAVPGASKEFDDEGTGDELYRGVGIIEKTLSAENKTTLTVQNVAHLRNNDGSSAACQINLSAAGLQFACAGKEDETASIKRALVTEKNVALHWNDDLERLYIGLSGVKRDDNTKSGVCLPLAMGYIDRYLGAKKEHEFKITSLVSELHPALFDPNTLNSPLGFFYTDDDNGRSDVVAHAKHIATMRTSTDKFYLISLTALSGDTQLLDGGIVLPVDTLNVYAIPLIAESNDPREKGALAALKEGVPFKRNVADLYYALPQEASEMPNIDDDSVLVGSARASFDGNAVNDLFTVGDTVYVTCDGQYDESSGIFASTALFNREGFIWAWTPWQRVMGDSMRVRGAGLDPKTGNFYMLTTADDSDIQKRSAFNTGSVSVWGKGFARENTDDVPLSKILADIFPSQDGGVFQLFPFDEFTPLFGSYTLLAAVGHNKIALIETASHVSGQLVPSKFEKGENIFEISGSVLTSIAPLIGVEIQKGSGPSMMELKLFIYGCGGIVTMALNENRTSLKDALESQLASSTLERFVETEISTPVYSMTRGPDYTVMALTDDGVFRIAYDGSDVTPLHNSLAINKTYAGSSIVTVANDAGNDAIYLLGTDNGLKVVNGTLEHDVPGQIMQMEYYAPGRVDDETLAADTLLSQKGIAYVLTYADRVKEDDRPSHPLTGKKVMQIYRLAVGSYDEDEQVDYVSVIDKKSDGSPRPFLQLDDYRTNFAVNGSTLFTFAPRDVNFVNFVTALPIGPGIKSSATMLEQQQDLQELLSLRDQIDHYHVGSMKHDTGSGSLVIPGDWGVRVND